MKPVIIRKAPRHALAGVALGLAVGLAGSLATSAAHAQGTYPTRTVRLIVPFAPGGGTDISARALAEQLRSILGQPIVVDNRPGGSGRTGTQTVADGTPEADARLERVLTIDPGMGVVRHADAGYPEALSTARQHGVRIPMQETSR